MLPVAGNQTKNQVIQMTLPFSKILILILFSLILIQCSEKNSEEYVQEGLEYLKREQYDSARKSFLKAIEKDANNPEGYYSLGGIYNYQKKLKKAELAFKSVLKIDPTHHNACLLYTSPSTRD